MGFTRKTCAAAAAGVLTIALAGCGDDGDGGDDFAEQSYQEIKDAAIEDMGDAESLRLSGTIEEDGQELTIDLAIGGEGECVGTIAMNGAEGEIISNSDGLFIKGDETFWESTAPGQAEVILDMLDGKWAKTPPQGDEGFGELCNLDNFVDELAEEDDEKENVEVGDVEEVDDQDAVLLSGEDEDGGTTRAWISVDSPHYILKMEKEGGDDPGQMSFSDYDEDVDASSPPEDEYVDITQGG